MKLCNYAGRLALARSDEVLDVEHASGGRFSSDPTSIYDRWAELREWAAEPMDGWDPLEFDRLGPPNAWPRQVFAIGLNYHDHAAESGHDSPQAPTTFTKFQSCLVGPGAVVELPSDKVDWEVELVVVMGARAHCVAAEHAWAHVAGLTVGQDLSERQVQLRPPAPQFSLGKSFPGFGPTGPWVVTPDELPDPDDLAITCRRNGEVVQEARTSQMVFGIPALIEQLSAIVPLLPGDLIFTGTPAGVGAARRPPQFLQPGDDLESAIEGIGSMTTRFK